MKNNKLAELLVNALVESVNREAVYAEDLDLMVCGRVIMTLGTNIAGSIRVEFEDCEELLLRSNLPLIVMKMQDHLNEEGPEIFSRHLETYLFTHEERAFTSVIEKGVVRYSPIRGVTFIVTAGSDYSFDVSGGNKGSQTFHSVEDTRRWMGLE